MLTIEPAFLLRPTKAGDVRVPIDGHWEAQYGDCDGSCVIRPCPLEAAADCLNNAVFWAERMGAVAVLNEGESK